MDAWKHFCNALSFFQLAPAVSFLLSLTQLKLEFSNGELHDCNVALNNSTNVYVFFPFMETYHPMTYLRDALLNPFNFNHDLIMNHLDRTPLIRYGTFFNRNSAPLLVLCVVRLITLLAESSVPL